MTRLAIRNDLLLAFSLLDGRAEESAHFMARDDEAIKTELILAAPFILFLSPAPVI